jgi:hypothetical protein
VPVLDGVSGGLFCEFGVVDELAVDGVGDASLEAAPGLLGGLGLLELAAVVDAAFGVEPDLRHGGDVQEGGSAAGCLEEPVSDLFAGGGVDGCGAGPGREVVAVGASGDVADVVEGPGGAGGADPGQLHQVGTPGQHGDLELLLEGLEFGVGGDQVGHHFDRHPPGCLTPWWDVTGLTVLTGVHRAAAEVDGLPDHLRGDSSQPRPSRRMRALVDGPCVGRPLRPVCARTWRSGESGVLCRRFSGADDLAKPRTSLTTREYWAAVGHGAM